MSSARRCVICDYVVEDDTLTLSACPRCGDTGVPCDLANDVTVRVNWHELHILVIWSEQWANAIRKGAPSSPQVVFSIARRLEKQYPELGCLTLGGELRELKSLFGTENVHTDIPHEPLFDPTDDNN